MSPLPPSEPLAEPRELTAGAAEIATGAPVHPIDRLRILSPDDWEQFVLEWATGRDDEYTRVERRAGAGDAGRDVLGFRPDGTYDLFQCKRYEGRLQPNQAWVELGKFLYWLSEGKFAAPRRYYFMAPRGIGTELSNLLDDPDTLRSRLIAEWPAKCEMKITSRHAVPLEGPLLNFVRTFDFTTFTSKPPHELVAEHSTTPWHAWRFGGGLPARPTIPAPPTEVGPDEVRYVRALLDAYSERLGKPLRDSDDLDGTTPFESHFQRSRREFYSAEALRAFSRDRTPPGTFDSLVDEVFDGIADTYEDDHDDGYGRVRHVVERARDLDLQSHMLGTRIVTRDRGGICHQMANSGRITAWTA